MASYGYGNLQDRAFVAFDRELDEGAWKNVATDVYEAPAKQSAAVLLTAPQPVVWKLRLRGSIAAVLEALAAPAVATLDATWDTTQRRLFHRIAIGIDDDNTAVRAAADRLREGLLQGGGTGQTQLDYDAEVDFGRQQIALTREGAALAADAKKLKLTEALADIDQATEALAKAIGRGTAEKRQKPSRRLRDAVAECAASFTAVHGTLEWFIARTPAGPDRDRLEALLVPLEALRSRYEPAETQTETPTEKMAPAAETSTG